MTYIRCPECGARALHVASACPKCHHVLAQNPMQLGADSALVVCRECEKYTPRADARCQFCGASLRRVRTSAAVAVALAVLALGGGTWGALRLWTRPEPEPVPPATAQTPPMVVPTEAEPEAAPIVVEPPPAVATVTRWTGAWLNLRDGPGHRTNILRPVAPGTRLEVANPVGGWWRVYERGVAVGFISGTELLRSPSDSLP